MARRFPAGDLVAVDPDVKVVKSKVIVVLPILR
jgi:hypothetical protein